MVSSLFFWHSADFILVWNAWFLLTMFVTWEADLGTQQVAKTAGGEHKHASTSRGAWRVHYEEASTGEAVFVWTWESGIWLIMSFLGGGLDESDNMDSPSSSSPSVPRIWQNKGKQRADMIEISPIQKHNPARFLPKRLSESGSSGHFESRRINISLWFS